MLAILWIMDISRLEKVMATKEKILDAALTLFAENGYDGTSVEQIANIVGIKAPSLYKDKELVKSKPDGFVIMTLQNERWADCIFECFPDAKKISRYAIKKDTKFDKDLLHKLIDRLPEGYELKNIDANIYDMCLSDPVTRDFVSSFESKEKYLDIGRGVVVMRSGRIVAGASSYTRYNEGIEIEVDTVEEERRKGLATAASAALILRCLDEGLYPSWDAQNMISVHLAEKLGYEYDHEYTAYEVSGEEGTHGYEL